ncbi:MaoC family dehydratase [Natronomonas halophila]|uniref:MaoC family dehydratase n=1 Tax=Natronomonas halophila TaxID=2747817 RepID=UPI0015B536CB|nr:MaoC family dehydratase [Natronomonas halophila]QLD85842.1 MaoC family dehydratase [Natronomonas halophila]
MPEIDPGADLPDWDVDIDIEGTDDAPLAVGDSIRFAKTLSDDDIERFALASGDTNPLHLDDEVAGETRFGGRIAHGILTAGLISSAVARLPGTAVYLSQDLEFRAPVRPDDRVTAEIEVVEALGNDRYRFETTAETADDTVIRGEATVLIE